MHPTEKDQKADLLAQLDDGLKRRGFAKKAGSYVWTASNAKILLHVYHYRFNASVRLDCGVYFLDLPGASLTRTPKRDEWQFQTQIDNILKIPSSLSPDLSRPHLDEYLDLVEHEAVRRMLDWCQPSNLATFPDQYEAFGCTANLSPCISEEDWKWLCQRYLTASARE